MKITISKAAVEWNTGCIKSKWEYEIPSFGSLLLVLNVAKMGNAP